MASKAANVYRLLRSDCHPKNRDVVVSASSHAAQLVEKTRQFINVRRLKQPVELHDEWITLCESDCIREKQEYIPLRTQL